MSLGTYIETDINRRWEADTPHHKSSEHLFNILADIDRVYGNDYFCWKSGGDGDNGEHLMYEMDIHFEQEEAVLDQMRKKSKPRIENIAFVLQVEDFYITVRKSALTSEWAWLVQGNKCSSGGGADTRDTGIKNAVICMAALKKLRENHDPGKNTTPNKD